MTRQPFFRTMAGISLSLAGFAGLLASFRDPSQTWTVTELWPAAIFMRVLCGVRAQAG